MSANRSTFFYEKKTTVTANFEDQTFTLPFASRAVKMAVVGGDVEFSFNGGSSVDGVLKAGDGVMDFQGLETQKLAFKQVSGAVTELRVWAWK